MLDFGFCFLEVQAEASAVVNRPNQFYRDKVNGTACLQAPNLIFLWLVERTGIIIVAVMENTNVLKKSEKMHCRYTLQERLATAER